MCMLHIGSPFDNPEYPAPDHLHGNGSQKQGRDLGEGARAVDADEFYDAVCLGKDSPRKQNVNNKRHDDGTVAITADKNEGGRERGGAGDERSTEGDNAEAGADRVFLFPGANDVEDRDDEQHDPARDHEVLHRDGEGLKDGPSQKDERYRDKKGRQDGLANDSLALMFLESLGHGHEYRERSRRVKSHQDGDQTDQKWF